MMTYVVVEAGVTVVEPVVATEPMSGSILTVLAFVVSQDSVADPPVAIFEG